MVPILPELPSTTTMRTDASFDRGSTLRRKFQRAWRHRCWAVTSTHAAVVEHRKGILMNQFARELERSRLLKRETSNRSSGHYTVGMRRSDLHISAFRSRRTLLEKARGVRGFVFLAVVTFMPFAAGFAQSQIGNGLPYPSPSPGTPPMNQTANPTADANRLMEDSMKHQDNLKRFELMNVQRQKEMTSDTAKLIELAHQLKIQTDKGAPDALSILEIRKAEMIEKLARNIQGKMRASVSN
jgi:hypothetical protein